MFVSEENDFVSFWIVTYTIHGSRCNCLLGAVRPGNQQVFHFVSGPQAKRDDRLRLREVAARRHDDAPLRRTAGAKLEDRADRMRISRGSLESASQPVAAEFLIIACQERRAVDLGEDEVQVAVAVDVGRSQTAPDDRLGQVADVGLWQGHKDMAGVFTSIPKQLGRLRVLLVWLHGIDRFLQMPVGLHHVGAAVEIEVVEEQAEAESIARGSGNAGARRLHR